MKTMLECIECECRFHTSSFENEDNPICEYCRKEPDGESKGSS